MIIGKCKIIDFPTFSGHDGNLSVIEGNQHIPFDINRIYYLHGLPETAHRGVHAHKELEQVIIAIAGSFNIIIDDGKNRKKLMLDNPTKGLYISPLIWREITSFSVDAVLLVLASEYYNPEDYFHEYDEFIEYINRD